MKEYQRARARAGRRQRGAEDQKVKGLKEREREEQRESSNFKCPEQAGAGQAEVKSQKPLVLNPAPAAFHVHKRKAGWEMGARLNPRHFGIEHRPF